MKVPLKQLFVSTAFIGLAVLIYYAPRGYPGVKGKAEGGQQQQQQSGGIETQIADVKKQLGADKIKKINQFEQQLSAANTPAAKIAALDSLTTEWDKQLRPFIAAHYSFEKSEIINTFAAWFETGNRFFALTGIIPPDKQDERSAVFSQAGEAFDRALAINPNDTTARTRAAICKVEGSPDPMQGILALRELVKQDSTNLEAQLNLGMFSLKTTQFDKAEKRFRTVIALDPDYKDGYWYLAGALEGQNRIDDAIRYYKEYIKRNKENSAENQEIEEYISKLKSKKN